MLRVFFTDHARERLLSRYGIQLFQDEEIAICKAISADIGESEDGYIEYDVFMASNLRSQPMRLRARVVVGEEYPGRRRGRVVTIVTSRTKKPSRKNFIRNQRRPEEWQKQTTHDWKNARIRRGEM